MKKYKCMNIGNCDNANTGEIFEIAEGEELKCPKCGSDMIIEVKPKSFGKLGIIIGAAVVIIGAAVGAFLALGGESKPTAINLDKTELELIVGQKELITPTAEPAEVKATFTFKANGKGIEVTPGGEVTALKAGQATITVKCEENPELRATCKVTVKEQEVQDGDDGGEEPQGVAIEAIKAEPGSLDLKVGDSQQITITVAPENQTEGVTLSSSDETVATISEIGEVKALKAGTATITVAAKESDVKAEVKVTVKKKGNDGDGGTTTGSNERNPNWGKYEGPRDAQGLPHGNGVLRITRSTTINGESAQPGERIEGVFRNGYVNMGTWYKNDGNAVVVKGIKVV